jgi:hypothetical protein
MRDNSSMNTMENKLINTVIRVQVHSKNDRKLYAKHSFENDGTSKNA